jgi:hypothetical protein
VDVSDNGSGIAAEVLPHVFELFAQGKDVTQAGQGGLGIGLWLVQAAGGAAPRAHRGAQRGAGRGQHVHRPPPPVAELIGRPFRLGPLGLPRRSHPAMR